MNREDEIIIDGDDLANFREWICLNMEGVTWQGRYEKEFEEFWQLFFIEGLSLRQMMERFEYAVSSAQIGPLISWFNWLKDRLLIYLFVFKDLGLYELAQSAQIDISKLSASFRIFFLDKFPYLDDYFSEVFQIGNVANNNLHITFKQIASDIQLTQDFDGASVDDIMPSMEVTLYSEWKVFIKKMRKDLYHHQLNLKNLKSNASIKKQLRFFQELFLLIILGGGVFYGVHIANVWYEDYLANKISVYEPQFRWLDKTLKYKPQSSTPENTFKFDLENIQLPEVTKDLERDQADASRFETESEVILSSSDSLPKDFSTTGFEQSEYEELRKGGYRDTRFGNRKVYRVMMTSVDVYKSQQTLNELLRKYSVTQVDNVKPGTPVPGGIYYNLYVPRTYLKEFLSHVLKIDEAVLYESRTRRGNPPGKNKVFVWIKTL